MARKEREKQEWMGEAVTSLVPMGGWRDDDGDDGGDDDDDDDGDGNDKKIWTLAAWSYYLLAIKTT